MRVERFYHSAPSAAESPAESVRSLATAANELSLSTFAFPQGLDAAAYALKKRLICPRWWLIGVMCQWLAKETDQLALQLALNEGDWVLSGPSVTVKSFPIVVALWTEIFAQSARQLDGDKFTLDLQLSRLLRGTSAELSAQREFLTQYLSSALRVQRVKTVGSRQQNKRLKQPQPSIPGLQLEAVGLVQIVENVVLKNADTLGVTFSRDPRRFFGVSAHELLPSALRNISPNGTRELLQNDPLSGSVISLQPDVLQALSRTTSPKKLCSYLSLEMMKKKDDEADLDPADEEQVWRGRALGLKELSKLHKEQLVRAQSFYDHGILSWENEAPKQRVRNLIGKSPKQADSGIVHCWRMSQHALDAIQFERALSDVMRGADHRQIEVCQAKECLPPESSSVLGERQSLSLSSSGSELASTVQGIRATFVAQPIEQPPIYRSERLVPMAETKKIEHDPRSTSSSAKAVTPTAVRETSPRTEAWNDDEFLMCVAEFYESLTPLQQQAFERERKKMSPEQFKKYVTPALMRLRCKN